MEFPSRNLQSVVNEFSKLPGIGKKTAARLALHLLKCPADDAFLLGRSIIQLREEIKYCHVCHNISEGDVCSICSNFQRNQQIICVVSDIKDLLVIERTRQFNGVYHVLGGLIDATSGIGPSQLNIDTLVNRVSNFACQEIILALTPNMEGDTTAFYIARKISHLSIKISALARGVPMGHEIEFTDEYTLARSIQNRVDFLVKGEGK